MIASNTTEAGGAGGGPTSLRKMNDRVLVVQVLVAIFLYVNCLLIFTFFKKEIFRTNARYIFFAHTLIVDCLFLILTNVLLLLSYLRIVIPVWLCVIISIVLSVSTFLTPLTLTAMSLERYVAICMPLRHAELSTPRRAIYCILIIHSLSSIQSIVTNSILFASAPPGYYILHKLCTAELVIVVHTWQRHIRTAISQLYFLVMSVTILFTYVRIMAVAKDASTETRKSTSKGLRTVILHSVQMTLCLVQFWCPFVEAAMLQIDLRLYIEVRYFDYIAFILIPRCLSPLVYGLRDEKFYYALRYFAFCGLNKNISPVLVV